MAIVAEAKPSPRTFRSRLDGAKIVIDVFEEAGRIEHYHLASVQGLQWPASWMILHMATHGGFDVWELI